jgi:hypothetical protein
MKHIHQRECALAIGFSILTFAGCAVHQDRSSESCETSRSCLSPSRNPNFFGVNPVSDGSYVTVANVWNREDGLPIAEKLCKQYGKSASFTRLDEGVSQKTYVCVTPAKETSNRKEPSGLLSPIVTSNPSSAPEPPIKPGPQAKLSSREPGGALPSPHQPSAHRRTPQHPRTGGRQRYHFAPANPTPRPSTWTETADQVLDSVARFYRGTSGSRH